ncbi:hypothetical protein IIZ72_00350 [Candidatus Saccharibacteria bacterium]|nr:hypothetical protein [Candidatus Saccharibacteria bacterium]
MENIPTPNSEDLVMPPNPMAKLSEMPDFKERLEQLREQEKKRGAKILAAVDEQRLDDIGEDIGREEVVVASEGDPHDPSDLVDSDSGIGQGQEEAERFTAAEAEAAAAAQAAAHEESERQEEQYNYAEEILPTPVTSDEEQQIHFEEFGGDGVALTASEPSSRLDRPILIRRGFSRPQLPEKKHMPSRHPEFLKNQSIAKKGGQHMVGNEKRPLIAPSDITERVKDGEDIHELIKNVDAKSVWLNMDEFVKNGASIEEVFDNMPKNARWLSIDKLVQNGYDVNKLVNKLSDNEVYLKAEELVKNGADVDRLVQRLESILQRLSKKA